MSHPFYPDFISDFPEADIPFEGVQAWLSQGPGHQIVFFDLPAGVAVPPHSHGAQWGVVLEGALELTISGETRVYRPGESYFIPAGAVHGATVLEGTRVIDVFADADRYRPKS